LTGLNPQQKLKTISVLPTLSPQEALRILASNSEELSKGDAAQMPRVTLFLAQATFSGYVAGYREAEEASYILFLEHDETRAQNINVVFLPVWSINAVRVYEADQVLHLLSGGKVEARNANIGISALRQKIDQEVLRLRSALQSDVKLEVTWETMSQGENSLLGLYELIDSFMSVVQEKIRDDFKRIAFKTLVTVIRFQNGPEAEICQEGQTLIVRATLTDRAAGRFSREEFGEAINEVLADP
jgi:hypothetical protein